MTDPVDLDQLRTAISSQEATISRHEELLRSLMEGFQAVAKCHNLAYGRITGANTWVAYHKGNFPDSQ